MSLDAPTNLRIVRTCQELHSETRHAQAAGKRVGIVMTMGALHEGHLSLVRASQQDCDFTVVTIFVNPTQFGPQEDLAQYPRDADSDLEQLAALDVDCVFVPSETEMYPPGCSTEIIPPDVAQRLEGTCRPGHFRGVVTVVAKLLQACPADVAYFGHKDYQQYLVIRQMARDLNIATEIRVCPTVREADGLALSSRNRYLSPAERQVALSISASLNLAARLAAEGQPPSAIATAMRAQLADAGIKKIDYLAIVDAETLADVKQITGPTLVAIAAYVGDTRLIDNRVIDVSTLHYSESL